MSTCAATVLGSLVEPSKTSTATGQPVAVQSRPKTICSVPFLRSRLWPALGEFAVGPLDVAGGQVVEHQGVFLEVALGEALLDGRLALDEPVHRGVQLLRVDGTEVEHFPERGDGAFGCQGAGGGELRLRVDDAGDEQCDDEVADATGASGEQGGECELADGGEHGGDVAVWEASETGEGVVGADELLSAEDAADGVDGVGGELGEVGEGSLLDAGRRRGRTLGGGWRGARSGWGRSRYTWIPLSRHSTAITRTQAPSIPAFTWLHFARLLGLLGYT